MNNVLNLSVGDEVTEPTLGKGRVIKKLNFKHNCYQVQFQNGETQYFNKHGIYSDYIISKALTEDELLAKIKTLEDELHTLRHAPKVGIPFTEWIPSTGKYIIDLTVGVVRRVAKYPVNDTLTSTGLLRDEQLTAYNSLWCIRKYSRLLAYKDEHCPNFSFTFGEKNWYINENADGTYELFYRITYKSLTEVYFPEDVAIELLRRIQIGEVVL